jgi:sec-independent protein translocase protein TatA
MVAAAGIFGMGAPELLIILVVVLLVFGASRVGDLGGSLGKGIREFRRNIKDDDDVAAAAPAAPAAAAPAPAAPLASTTATPTATLNGSGQPEVISAIRCPNCGTLNSVGSRHCNQCGASIAAPVS